MRNAAEVERICLAALERPASERAAYLADACGGDDALRQDVESLLAHASPAEQFFEHPAVNGPDALAGLSGLTAGQRLGPYQIIAKLGAGGMGEVYRARDTQLGRDVAIKILPPVFAVDPNRLARFEREARVLATLNHPHIATIYGIEAGSEEDGPRVRALVMELVEGVTLEERMARGPLPVAEALGIAVQIADALDAAHEHGVIHRDVKPANIKITRAGLVKVLDFGLAKLADPAGHDDPATSPPASLSPTITSLVPITGMDMLVGTPAYMSPEQAKGLSVDARADVWAFGVVLYEMLTGRRGFDGATPLDVLGNVLTKDLDWSVLPHDIPPSLRALLRHCVHRERSQRMRAIGDIRLLLEDGLGETRVATAAPAARSRQFPGERYFWIILVCAAAGIGSGMTWWARPPARVPEQMQSEFSTPPTIEPMSIAISPNGKTLAFVASADGSSRLFVRTLETGATRSLAGTDRARYPFWSPDSHALGFSADAQLKRIDVESGTVQIVASGGALGGTWNQDGTILYDRFPGGVLHRVSAEGGEPVPVTHSSTEVHDQWFPQFLPDQRRFLFYGTGTAPGIYIGELGASVAPRRILEAQAVAYASSGHLLFVRQGTLFGQAFDATRLELTGVPSVIAEHIVSADGTAALAASAAGHIVYRTGPQGLQHEFAWFDRTGAPLGAVAGSEFGDHFNTALSPNGDRLATSRRISGTGDIWVLDLRRMVPTRFTFDGLFDLTPVWSPDGATIAFSSNRRAGTDFDVYIRGTSGAADDQVVVTTPNVAEVPSDWSRDGRHILYTRNVDGPLEPDVWTVSLPDRKTEAVVHTPFSEANAQFSPDGRWLAYQSNETGRREIYLQRFKGGGSRVPVSGGGGVQARWRPNGKELFFIDPDDRLMAVSVSLPATDGDVQIGTAKPLFPMQLAGTPQSDLERHYMVSPDGERFLVDTRKEMTLPISMLLNWTPKKP